MDLEVQAKAVAKRLRAVTKKAKNDKSTALAEVAANATRKNAMQRIVTKNQPIHEVAQAVAVPFPIVSITKESGVTTKSDALSLPCVLSVDNAHNIWTDHKEWADKFCGKFTHGIVDRSNALDHSKLPKELQDTVQPLGFAVARHQETCFAEPNHFPTLRVSIDGARTITAVSVMAHIEFFSSTKGVSDLEFPKIYHMSKSMTAVEMASFIETGNAIYRATIGPSISCGYPQVIFPMRKCRTRTPSAST